MCNDLIIRYLNGDISDSELRLLTSWLRTDPKNFQEFTAIRDIWNSAELSAFEEEKIDHDLVKVYSAVNKIPRHKRIFIRAGIQIAATILLSVIISTVYLWIRRPAPSEKAGMTGYTIVNIPAGQKGQVVLPDGTDVWLNSGTSIKYIAAFDDSIREIYLDGEAFVHVAKDRQRPFLVKMSAVTLRVLGTTFNVKCYDEEKTIETTLIEGSLKIESAGESRSKFKDVILKPNERAIFYKEKQAMSIDLLRPKVTEKKLKKIDKINLDNEIDEIQSIIAWKDNDLIFSNETLADICHKMERWYGISIRIESENLKKIHYSGKFVYNESIEQVMDVFRRTTPIEYSLNRNILLIKERN